MPLVYRKTKAGRLEYRDEAPHLIAKRVAEGWCASRADALAGAKPVAHVVASPVLDEHEADNAPPTRAELEAKAAELGIKLDKRWSDKTLSERVDDALRG